MSNHSPLSNESIGPSSAEADRNQGRPLVRTLKGPAQFLSFWIAIALPFIHLPLLMQGLGDPSVTLTFLSLLAINVFALYAGHGHNQQ
ncbi:hypothetical protein G6M89_07585 [Natronolimnobius sp. AArcel1]|uniref:hypothetical protein n=1 Tax=Natronolimnobius sp. AArcel1 TaxID=1679093 RepID=UPI0013EBBCFB|nr:hypothetical protein [Natronolimnobius sp. AArcel1]NGM68873.1 hypothetical protein [Natronolimnobius sp. AArcel1]